MSLCPGCADKARNLDALPLIEVAPENIRARLLERREAVLAGSLNEAVPGRLNREGREGVLRERWQYPRSVAHLDAGRGMVAFQRAYAPDALVGALGMQLRAAVGAAVAVTERRWVGLTVPVERWAEAAALLVGRNVIVRPVV
jgi:hypothetical protein